LLLVLEKAAKDDSFLSLLAENPAGALASYDLTAEEKGVVASGDIDKIESFIHTLDERLKKWFVARLQKEKW
jgi:hypothetical protein